MTDRNRPSLSRTLDVAWPGSLVVCAILALTAPMPFPPVLVPDFVLMLVFLAAAFREEVFPVWLCFALGLLVDLLGSTPVGLHALVYLMAHGFAASQRRYLDWVLFLWGGFALVAGGAGTLRWALVSLYHETWLHPEPQMINTLISILVFPLISQPFQRLIGGERYA